MKHISMYEFVVHTIVVLLLSSMALHAHAEANGEEAPDRENIELQSPVKAWLELQSSGRAASPQAQPLSGPVMDRAHERYLKSFTHPMPPYFEHEQPINY